MRHRVVALAFAVTLAAAAADWPEWRGRGRRGVWEETGLLPAFPKQGLQIKWRTPIGGGFSGPAVAAGRVFVTDFRPASRHRGAERILCLDERTGDVIWAREWEADYTGIQMTYATGPRATPTVDGELVYALGAAGRLVCLRTADGAVVWERDYVRDFGLRLPVWGVAAAPLVYRDRLICLVGGAPDAGVVAVDKRSGRERWRASGAGPEPGYSQPLLVEYGGATQAIVWHSAAVSSFDPMTGRQYWNQPFRIHLNLPVATPVHSGPRLLVSSFFNGSLMMELARDRPAARLAWKGRSDSEIRTDGLHALITTPVIDGDYIYGICSYGQLRCLRADTGARVWETLAVTGEQARWAAAFIVRNGDRYFINNDAGELIIAKLSPQGYQEISRTGLIKPTSRSGNRRKAGAVNWSHPAYANRHIFARNDEEILCASLAAN